MKYLEMSQHATERSQQRGIPQDIIEFILWYGTPHEAPGGAQRYIVNGQVYSRLMHRAKIIQRQLERMKGKAVIVKDDVIVTEYHLR